MKPSRLEKAITTLNAAQSASTGESHISGIDARALLSVTIAFLVALLSVPLRRTDMIIWFAVYPILTAPLAHVAYERIFVNSLYVLPVLLLIGIFNPIYDRTVAFTVGSVPISNGWVSFISIIIRGLLSMQALLLLIRVTGFNDMCEAMRRLKVPAIIVTQLLMVYRYLTVLLQEALSMQRARQARGYGRTSLGPRLWGAFVGQLLLRTIERSRRIDMAMRARGFNGSLTTHRPGRWVTADTVYCLIWLPLFALLRLCNISSLLLHLVKHSQ